MLVLHEENAQDQIQNNAKTPSHVTRLTCHILTEKGPSYTTIIDINIVDVGVREEILNNLSIFIVGFEGPTITIVERVFTEGYNSLASLYIALIKATRDFLNTNLLIG